MPRLPSWSGSGNWEDREREGHTEEERSVKVRHDSVTRAAFLFWHLMREQRSGDRGEVRRYRVRADKKRKQEVRKSEK